MSKDNSKKAKVVMLATEKASTLNIHSETGILRIGANIESKNKTAINQHLYIVNDDEIKLGDYYYCKPARSVEYGIIKCDSERLVQLCKDFKHESFKVIATTDLELNKQGIPKPSESFVKKFVDKYNKSEIIADILVEWQDIYYETPAGTCYDEYHGPKVSFQNEITIHPIKNSWTREEVESLLINFSSDFSLTSSKSDSNYVNEWIENNL